MRCASAGAQGTRPAAARTRMTEEGWTGRTIRCPACGGPSRYAPDNPSRPFCGERCRHLDLGAWASESYRVEAPPPRDEDWSATTDPG